MAHVRHRRRQRGRQPRRAFAVVLQQVAQWNQLPTTAAFKPGQTIVVYLAGKSSSGVHTGRKTANIRTARPPAPRTQLRATKVSKTP